MRIEYADHVWTYDFVFDQTLAGTTLKILTLTDEFTRQSLALRVAEAFTSMEVSRPTRKLLRSVARQDSSAATTVPNSLLVIWASACGPGHRHPIH